MEKSLTKDPQAGHYLGTEMDEKWWKRYRKDKFLARGNGKYWLEEDSFCFLRYLTKTPLKIRFQDIVDIKIGKWHSGKWYVGWPIVKILWMKEGMRLSSGFVVSKDQDFVIRFIDDLRRRAGMDKQSADNVLAEANGGSKEASKNGIQGKERARHERRSCSHEI